MQHHTAQQLESGPRTGKWVYTGGNHRMGRVIECCMDRWQEMLQAEDRDASPAWEHIGHDTADEAYAHMRQRLLEALRLDVQFSNWSGCKVCDTPTKSGADIPPCHFTEPLCDEHRNRETVERLWQGPGDWSGSW